MILIATHHGRVDATGFGLALCQFCGRHLPVTHPQAIDLIYSDCGTMHFTAVCDDCWTAPPREPQIVHHQETKGGGHRREQGCRPTLSSGLTVHPPSRTERSERREGQEKPPRGQGNAPEATPEQKRE